MNTKRLVLVALAAVVVLTVLSSCQRKYGCPNNFSIQESVEKAR